MKITKFLQKNEEKRKFILLLVLINRVYKMK